jgi:DNA-binding NarL/FixJ family response regulator
VTAKLSPLRAHPWYVKPTTREKAGLAKLLENRLGARSVVEASRFDEAMEYLEEQRFDLAIFDLGIPGLDGPRELEKVRRKWPRMKLVVLSGSGNRADILISLEAGVHGYFVKIASMEILANRLGQVMAGEIHVPSSLADLDADTAPVRVLKAGKAAAPSGALLARLTPRQREVLECLVEGLANRDIAKRIDRSEGMAKAHVAAVFKVLGARSRTHAASIGRALLGSD